MIVIYEHTMYEVYEIIHKRSNLHKYWALHNLFTEILKDTRFDQKISN